MTAPMKKERSETVVLHALGELKLALVELAHT
jgi:hypothetical protein